MNRQIFQIIFGIVNSCDNFYIFHSFFFLFKTFLDLVFWSKNRKGHIVFIKWLQLKSLITLVTEFCGNKNRDGIRTILSDFDKILSIIDFECILANLKIKRTERGMVRHGTKRTCPSVPIQPFSSNIFYQKPSAMVRNALFSLPENFFVRIPSLTSRTIDLCWLLMTEQYIWIHFSKFLYWRFGIWCSSNNIHWLVGQSKQNSVSSSKNSQSS